MRAQILGILRVKELANTLINWDKIRAFYLSYSFYYLVLFEQTNVIRIIRLYERSSGSFNTRLSSFVFSVCIPVNLFALLLEFQIKSNFYFCSKTLLDQYQQANSTVQGLYRFRTALGLNRPLIYVRWAQSRQCCVASIFVR